MGSIISKFWFLKKKKEAVIRIAIDATPLQGAPSGIPIYVSVLLAELIKHPELQFFLYFSCKYPRWEFLGNKNIVARSLHFFHRRKKFWFCWIVPLFLWIDRVDLFWGPHQSIPFRWIPKGVKTCLTVHDIAFILYPDTVLARERNRLSELFFPSLEKADAVISVSQGTMKKITPYLEKRVSQPIVSVVLPPVRECFRKSCKEQDLQKTLCKLSLQRGRFFLSVGTLEPRKNVSWLLQNYLKFLNKQEDPQSVPDLILVGRWGWETSALRSFIDQFKIAYPGKLQMLGFVEEEVLHHLYLTAAAYLCSSLYEGYGMPLAEATYLGCKVVCPDQDEMKEATNNQGVYYDPDDEAGWLAAIQQVIDAGGRNCIKARGDYFTAQQLSARLLQTMLALIQKKNPIEDSSDRVF